jgi:hypothetical protein
MNDMHVMGNNHSHHALDAQAWAAPFFDSCMGGTAETGAGQQFCLLYSCSVLLSWPWQLLLVIRAHTAAGGPLNSAALSALYQCTGLSQHWVVLRTPYSV